MTLLTTAVVTIHLAFAAIWTGGVLFFAWGVLDRALSGGIDAGPFGAITGRLVWLSRASALLLFVTGGHLAGTLYTVESLTGSGRGHLVLTMLALWLVLAGLVEIGASRIRAGTEELKVREPARAARRPLYAASVVAIALLVVAGLLSTA
jgi:putative copper export protein